MRPNITFLELSSTKMGTGRLGSALAMLPCSSAPPLCGLFQERVIELAVILLTLMVGATGGLTTLTV